MLIQLLQLRLPRSKPAFDELVTDCFNVIYKNSHCNWKPHPDEWIRNSTIPVDATVERHGVVRYWQIFGPYGIFRMRSIKKESKTLSLLFLKEWQEQMARANRSRRSLKRAKRAFRCRCSFKKRAKRAIHSFKKSKRVIHSLL